MVYCGRCNTYHPHMAALRQHEENSSRHHICGYCELDFTTWNGLKEHYVQSPRHDYCQRCDEHFQDEEELFEHYEDSHIYCRDCNMFFKNEYGREEHWRQSTAHHYCADCKRLFMSASNLNSHRNSSIHKPKDVGCPFKNCGLSFVSRSALILHLESGNCRSGVGRREVNQFIQKFDKHNVITDPSRMITGGSNMSQDVQYIASDASWNSYAFECVLCHGQYSSLRALNQHLASPRHQDKIYICPLSSCRQRFTALSALCQHIESERCGVSKFRNVQNTLAGMDSLLGQMRRLTTS